MSLERPLRSLIVDDDPGSTDRLRALLERWGHDVRVASEARTAEVLTRVWRPDVVLLELVLPDADGVTLIPCLRTGDETAARRDRQQPRDRARDGGRAGRRRGERAREAGRRGAAAARPLPPVQPPGPRRTRPSPSR